MFFGGPARRGARKRVPGFWNTKSWAEGEFTSPEQKKKRGPRRVRRSRWGEHDHVMDEIRYFAMSLKEQEPLAAGYVERTVF